MKSSIRISKGGNQIRFSGPIANEAFKMFTQGIPKPPPPELPKESPVNNPLAACGHCAKLVPQPEMVGAADGRLFCGQTCRAAAEIFSEWQAD